MLQFIAKGSLRYSIAEESQMALEGGCRWIQLSAESFGDNNVVLLETAKHVAEMCRGDEAFLVIEDNLGMVEELHAHGVFLTDNSRETVMGVRERLGAEAVVGVAVSSVEEALHLAGLDVDYVSMNIPADCSDKKALMADVVSRLTDAGVDFHVVATGNVSAADFGDLLSVGVAGFALSYQIADAEDPVAATVAALDVLNKLRLA